MLKVNRVDGPITPMFRRPELQGDNVNVMPTGMLNPSRLVVAKQGQLDPA